MSSSSAPTYYFSGINFNSSYYNSSSGSTASGIYLKKTMADTAQGLITFNGGLNSASIQSLTTGNINVYTNSMFPNTLTMGGNNTPITCNSTFNFMNTMSLSGNQFRFVPWTTVSTVSTNLATVLNNPSGANLPAAGNNVSLKYRYCVIGNSMYLNYTYNHTALGSASSGTGYYQYLIPSPYTLNTSDIVISSTSPYPNGTKVGSCVLMYGAVSAVQLGSVHLGNLNSTNGLLLWGSNSTTINCQNHGFFGFSQAVLTVSFEAIIPIN
jgi:hypothetical protein